MTTRSRSWKKRAVSREKICPPIPHEFIRALNSLAAVNMHLGRHDVAEAVLREIVDGRAIDIELEEYAAALNNLSLSYARRHWTIEALPYMKRAIALKRKLFGERHPAYLGNLEDMSQMLAEFGHDAEAAPYYARSATS